LNDENNEKKKRFYDTKRFGQPQIRIYHQKGTGTRYLLKCGCCDEKLEIYYADDGLEINGVNGSIDDWRELLLPLLKKDSEKSSRSRRSDSGFTTDRHGR